MTEPSAGVQSFYDHRAAGEVSESRPLFTDDAVIVTPAGTLGIDAHDRSEPPPGLIRPRWQRQAGVRDCDPCDAPADLRVARVLVADGWIGPDAVESGHGLSRYRHGMTRKAALIAVFAGCS